MTTRILDVPLVQVTLDLTTNEDWLDAWAYVDADGNPIPLAGLSMTGIFRPDTASEAQPLTLATQDVAVPSGLPFGRLVVGGVGGNVLALAVGVATIRDLSAGTYGADVVAVAGGVTRRIAVIAAAVSRGYTR